MLAQVIKRAEQLSSGSTRKRQGNVGIVFVDVQNDFCAENGLAWKHVENKSRLRVALQGLLHLCAEAQERGVPCFFVRSYFDQKYKLAPVRRKHMQLGIIEEVCKENTWGSEFCAISPLTTDVIVTKHTNDAFLYTFLEPALRTAGIDTIILAGVFTEICIFETAMTALKHGFDVAVPENCVSGLMEQCAHKAMSDMRASGVVTISSADLGNMRSVRAVRSSAQSQLASEAGTDLLSFAPPSHQANNEGR